MKLSDARTRLRIAARALADQERVGGALLVVSKGRVSRLRADGQPDRRYRPVEVGFGIINLTLDEESV